MARGRSHGELSICGLLANAPPQQNRERAAEARFAHGASKSERTLAKADRTKARQNLDQHRLEKGDDR
jgi:hypothetical protein